jgi:hypothetical protein
MDDVNETQLAQQYEQPEYTRKEFKRAADDLYSCLDEALKSFDRFEKEFTDEVKGIKKYSDSELINYIWGRKVRHSENASRGDSSAADQGSRNSNQYRQNRNEESNGSASGILILQDRIRLGIEAILECRKPEPSKDEAGPQVRLEEVKDFEIRMQRTSERLSSSLPIISYNVQAFRMVISDLKTMFTDIELFHHNLWGEKGQEQDASRQDQY